MNRWWTIAIALMVSGPSHAAVIERLVTNLADYEEGPIVPLSNVEGTLRTVLHDACLDAGDDWIRFDKINTDLVPNPRVHLQQPLVIPESCNGTVTLDGSPQPGTTNPEIAISAVRMTGEGGRVPGDFCTLNIYSNGHTVNQLVFVDNAAGAGVCVFGEHNTISHSKFGAYLNEYIGANRYDIVLSSIHAANHPTMTASSNAILGNRCKYAKQHALWIEGTGNTISANEIEGSANHGVVLAGPEAKITGNHISANGGCPPIGEALPSQPATCNPLSSLGGAGIFVDPHGRDAQIGGLNPKDANTIQYNMGGGVVLDNSDQIRHIYLRHNVISKNYNGGIGIDLKNDGFTANDVGDSDAGPNTLFNTVEHFQMFPLAGKDHYWGWGVAFQAKAVEVARVAQEDVDRAIPAGGADSHISDFSVDANTFTWWPNAPEVKTGTAVTTLAHDASNNTSEYGLNAWANPDADLDGIPDDAEIISNPDEPDTDLDGLPDPVEDRNRNGVCDLGETCAALSDTDKDGLSDWAETRGDGRYNPKTDSNPWKADTDGDGLKDGQEDTNNNGIWEGYLGETSPLLADSDQDGFADGQDSCVMMANPQQEPWFCL